MTIEMLINDVLAKLKEIGIDATATTCLNQAGEIISFEVKIVDYLL